MSLLSWLDDWIYNKFLRAEEGSWNSWLNQDTRRAKLTEQESFWTDLQPFLAEKGYALRARYQPEWVPSWRLNGEDPWRCEDGNVMPWQGRIMDAFHLKDNARVGLKRILKTSRGQEEIDIMAYLANAEPRSSNTRNRCVPLLASFDPGPQFDSFVVVMPLLQRITDIPFLTLGDFVAFVGQIFEGLAFLHEHNVEHRDICLGNVMMYAEPLYPKGHHPVWSRCRVDRFINAAHLRLSDIDLQYFIIDYGLANRFSSLKDREPVLSPWGQDTSAPELQVATRKANDGFALDVYCLGNLVKECFLDQSPPLKSLLGPLVASMMHKEPSERLTAQESLLLFREIRSSLSSHHVSHPLHGMHQSFISKLWYDAVYYFGNLKRTLWPRHFEYLTSTYKQFAHLPYVT